MPLGRALKRKWLLDVLFGGVLCSPHTAGPAEIHACGGGFGPRHDGIRHRAITLCIRYCASASPGIPCRKAGERPNLYGSSRRVSGNGPTTPSNRQAIAIIVWRGANSGRDIGSLKDEHHSQRTSGCLAVDAASSPETIGKSRFFVGCWLAAEAAPKGCACAHPRSLPAQDQER